MRALNGKSTLSIMVTRPFQGDASDGLLTYNTVT
jgi:hypothetical protein